MLLRVSPNYPLRTVVSEVTSIDSSDKGTPLYRVYTPNSFRNRKTTIYRISSSFAYDDTYSDHFFDAKNDKDSEAEGLTYEDLEGVRQVAAYNWKTFKATTMDYDGKNMKVNDFLTHKKFLWVSFNGPDGKHYTWHSANYLTVGDEKVEVARFHDQRLFSKRKAHLEIHNTGLHMIDLIVATWIYMYAEQKNAEAGAAAGAAAASSSAVAAAVA